MKHVLWSRRQVLTTAAMVAGAVAIDRPGPVQAAVGTYAGHRSANGWPVLADATWHDIEGSGQRVKLAAGGAALILVYVARRFHYEIDQLRAGDVRGHRTDRRAEEAHESNYLSGTALCLRPSAYPAGVAGGWYPRELTVLRDILAQLDGVVAWGGDFHRPCESHFEIAHPPGHPAFDAVSRKLTRWASGPGGEGAGATDAFSSARGYGHHRPDRR